MKREDTKPSDIFSIFFIQARRGGNFFGENLVIIRIMIL